MKNVIPHFTAEALTSDRLHEDFPATALFLDISGFTAMTARLMVHGKEGAEVLSAILNSLFTDLIDAVGERGGFIATFAGDAFTALFPGPLSPAPVYAAQSLQKVFAARGRQQTRFGDFHLTAKVGLSFGQVSSGIVGARGQRAFYFRGPAVDGAAEAEHRASAGQTILDGTLQNELGSDVATSALADSYFVLDRVTRPEIDPPVPGPPDRPKEVLAEFVPQAVLELGLTGEFRSVVSVFLSLREPSAHEQVDQVAGAVLRAAGDYGGYFNSLDFGDKGCTILVLFGAPVAHEDDTVRAADFALRVASELGNGVRIGMTAGTVYAGPVGSERRATYTALGSVVNLSARLMASAAWGDVICDAAGAALPAHYQKESLGAKSYKGISEPVETFRLSGRAEVGAQAAFTGELIGRSTELAALEESVAPLEGRRFAGVLLLTGEAGCGKSRLLQEFAARLDGRATTATLPCDGILRKSLNPAVHHLALSLGTSDVRTPEEKKARFEQGFDTLLGELRATGHTQAVEIERELTRTKSLLAALLGIHYPGSLYEELDAQRRFENTLIALKDLFRARSLIRPLVLVFEDIHWLDSDTKTLLGALTRNMGAFPILIVAAGRNADDGSTPELGLDSETKVRHVELGAIPEGSRRDYVASKLGATPSEELARFIAGRAEGNPFYMEQYCLYLQANGLVTGTDVLNLKQAATDLPTGVNSLLTARLDRLRSELRMAVQAASILGRDFERELLGGMLANPDPSHLLSEGEGEQIWSPETARLYRFRQNLLRDAAYEMQLKERLRELHGMAAHLIESAGSDETRYADLAFHYEQAGDVPKTRHYLELAARHAQANYENERAIHFNERLLVYATSDEERVGVYEREAAVYDVLGRWDDAERVLELGLALTRDQGLAKRRAGVLTRFGEVCQKRGQYDRAVTLLEEAAGLARTAADPALEAGARTFLGRTRWSMGRYPEALASLEEAIDLRRRTDDRRGLALALYYAGVVDRDRGDYPAALRRYDESLALFREVGDRMLITYPVYDIGVIHLYQGRLDEALENFSQASDIYQEIGYQSGSSAALLNLGVIAGRRGRLSEAAAYYERSLQTAEELGEKLAIAYALFSIGTVHYQERDFPRTLHYFEKAFQIMKGIGARGYYGYVLSYLVCTYARMGQTAKALKAAVQHFRNIADTGSDVENGRTHLGVALALSRAGALQGPNSQQAADEIARATEVPPAARAHFERAIEKARAADYVITLLPALREFAAFLFANAPGEAALAGQCLKEAAARAQASGMSLELALIQRTAQENHVPLGS